MTLKQIIPIFIVMIITQACGQVGPLYMPDEPPPIYVPDDQEK